MRLKEAGECQEDGVAQLKDLKDRFPKTIHLKAH